MLIFASNLRSVNVGIRPLYAQINYIIYELINYIFCQDMQRLSVVALIERLRHQKY